jgi:SPP1 family predicted phage head-tail adaptor
MNATVKAGDLRHRIIIESPTRLADGGGGSTTEWHAVAEVWAAIWSRSVEERMSADRVSGRASHDIWIRYRGDVTPDMRMRCGARVFDVLGAIDVEDRGRWLRCPSEERDL